MASHDETLSPPSKRKAPAEGAKSKKTKKDEGDFAESDEEEVDLKCTPAEAVEIRKINKFLKQAYLDAPKATQNPLIHHRVCPISWNLIYYQMEQGRKVSLASRLLNEEGWTSERMMKVIGSSPNPIGIFPLKRSESRALWESIVYRRKLNDLRSNAYYQTNIPQSWYGTKFQSKVFMATNALSYGKEIVAVIASHQRLFLAKKPFHFRSICDDLGWELSASFCDYFFPILFVICADPSLVSKTVSSIKGTWGEGKVQKKVKKALKEAAKNAETQGKIKYKGAFRLLKDIFPNTLK